MLLKQKELVLIIENMEIIKKDSVIKMINLYDEFVKIKEEVYIEQEKCRIIINILEEKENIFQKIIQENEMKMEKVYDEFKEKEMRILNLNEILNVKEECLRKFEELYFIKDI